MQGCHREFENLNSKLKYRISEDSCGNMQDDSFEHTFLYDNCLALFSLLEVVNVSIYCICMYLLVSLFID